MVAHPPAPGAPLRDRLRALAASGLPLRVLLVKMSSLGDLVHALPTAAALKRGLGCRLTWVVNAAYADLVRCCRAVDAVLPFDRQHPLRGLSGFLRALRRERYHMALDLMGLLKSALIARLARAEVVLGASYNREGARFLYHACVGPQDLDRHAVLQNLDAATYLGLEADPGAFPLTFPPPETPLPSARPVAALIPGARWATKRWPEERFAAVAGRLLAEGIHVLVVGEAGADEESHWPAGVQDLRGKTSLVELGAVLTRADLVIANDTGPMHLAAALNRPVIALMGPTDPRRTGPAGEGHRVLSGSPACSPCFSRTCRNPDRLCCLTAVEPEAVLAAAREVLRRREPARRPALARPGQP
ncbi:MAG: glycosyltransferase family 9 protein [candidate division NC10 bacterium]|nr:glycosyltransferase family 9 protein [candidate division NC10 bacterium]